jgi:hypothetical protein
VRELRGDQMTRRYLNRIEVVLGRTKWRLDLRSSDWPAQLALILWRIVPNELRGQPGERRFRAAALAVFERALAEPGRRDHWVAEVRRLHALASEHRLRDLPAAELEAMAAG